MSQQFKTPQEAIQAYETSFTEAWKQVVASAKLDEAKDPKTYNAAKMLFRAGYSAGAKWVSGAIVERMIAQNPSASKS